MEDMYELNLEWIARYGEDMMKIILCDTVPIRIDVFTETENNS